MTGRTNPDLYTNVQQVNCWTTVRPLWWAFASLCTVGPHWFSVYDGQLADQLRVQFREGL